MTGNQPNFLAEKEAFIIESKRLDKKVREYEKEIKAGTFEFEIKWEIDLKKIDLKKLNSTLVQEIHNKFLADYSIIELNLDKVVARYGSEKSFPKDKLWVKRTPTAMARLIELAKKGNKIIPPIIMEEGKGLGIIDGHHRIALCRYLKLETIPFIIETNQITNVALLK